jgi:hypothetical protein
MPPQLIQQGELRIEAYSWEDFKSEWLSRHWQQGQHMCVMAPTGVGKSTLVAGVIGERKWVGVLGIKGMDDVLIGLAKQGFQVVKSWPLPLELRRKLQKGEPVHVIFTVPGRTPKAKAARRALCARAMAGMSEQGNWAIVTSDLALLGWRKFGNLNEQITEALIEARAAGISMVNDIQALDRIPHYAHSQASVLAAGPFPDKDICSEVGRIMGRSRAEMRGVLKALGDEEPPGTPRRMWIVATRSQAVPLALVRPPFVG